MSRRDTLTELIYRNLDQLTPITSLRSLHLATVCKHYDVGTIHKYLQPVQGSYSFGTRTRKF